MTIFSRTFLGAYLVREDVGREGRAGEKGAARPRRRLRNMRNGILRSQLHSHPDLTRLYSGLIVITFCLFIIEQPHISARLYVSAVLCTLWDGMGAYQTRISSRTNATATILHVCISANLICNLSFIRVTFCTIFVKDLEDLNWYDSLNLQ